MFVVEISNRQNLIDLDLKQVETLAIRILQGEGIPSAQLSIAIVDDVTIHGLNRQYLNHDYPTDVLSFLLHVDSEKLEGEVVVSAEMAGHAAAHFGWTAANELLLYVVHGVLHLVGYDDSQDEPRQEMRSREKFYLAQENLVLSYDEQERVKR